MRSGFSACSVCNDNMSVRSVWTDARTNEGGEAGEMEPERREMKDWCNRKRHPALTVAIERNGVCADVCAWCDIWLQCFVSLKQAFTPHSLWDKTKGSPVCGRLLSATSHDMAHNSLFFTQIWAKMPPRVRSLSHYNFSLDHRCHYTVENVSNTFFNDKDFTNATVKTC